MLEATLAAELAVLAALESTMSDGKSEACEFAVLAALDAAAESDEALLA